MKNIVFFPYHPDLLILMEHKDSLNGFRISGFISYKEDDKQIKAMNDSIGAKNASYDLLLRDCDAVVLLDNYREYNTEKYFRVIEDAHRYEKEVLITPLAQSQLNIEDFQGRLRLLEHLPDGMRTVNTPSKTVQSDR